MVKAAEPVRTQAPGVWPEESVRKQSGTNLCRTEQPCSAALGCCTFLSFRQGPTICPAFVFILGDRILLCGFNWPRMCNDPPSSAS